MTDHADHVLAPGEAITVRATRWSLDQPMARLVERQAEDLKQAKEAEAVLREQIRHMAAERKALQSDLLDAEADVEMYAEANRELIDEVKLHADAAKKLRAKNEDLLHHNRLIDRQNNILNVEADALRVQLSTCERNWQAKNDEAVRYEENYAALVDDLGVVKAERDQLSHALQAADQNYTDLQRMVGQALKAHPHFNPSIGPF